MTSPSSITHSLQPQQTQLTNLIHTTQQIEANIANHQPKNFSNIKELTGLNIISLNKVSDRMVTAKHQKPRTPTTNTKSKANQGINPIKMNGKFKEHKNLEPKQYKRK